MYDEIGVSGEVDVFAGLLTGECTDPLLDSAARWREAWRAMSASRWKGWGIRRRDSGSS